MQTQNLSEEEMLHLAAVAFGRRGGSRRSPAQLAALAKNRRNCDGRTPTTPDGIARKALRNALEAIFGKPLPKEGAVARLVHKMSSARTLRRVWPAVAEQLPPNEIEPVRAKMEALVAVLETTGGPAARRAPSQD